MLRDIVLPAEYAKGLEALLTRQQQAERMVFDLEIKQKEVRTAELEAEADRIRQVKAAEALGQVRVLQAKAEADAMQHTLPLKEKQIQQSRLEAEARKEATLKNAEAAAEAKVIDSKAEVQKLTLIAGADAHRVRVMGQAESERMKLDSDLLKENPLLIQKIVAERLSDKMQIMMVPTSSGAPSRCRRPPRRTQRLPRPRARRRGGARRARRFTHHGGRMLSSARAPPRSRHPGPPRA